MTIRKNDIEMISLKRHSMERTSLERIKRNRKRRRVQRRVIIGLAVLLVAFFGIRGIGQLNASRADEPQASTIKENMRDRAEAFLNKTDGKSDCPESLTELLDKNPETLDFVKDYSNRDQYLTGDIDLTGDMKSGTVPLLMQWDKRWGYRLYGGEMIALAGCGPTCMTMAYLYLTGDTSMNPAKMADYAADNGYYTKEGTSWSLWTDGSAGLGLKGSEIGLDENLMKRRLDEGGLIVCSMGPGDFTTTGHFILLYGYDENGFFVNDPNRRENSEKKWDFGTLQSQIKNLWVLTGA